MQGTPDARLNFATNVMLLVIKESKSYSLSSKNQA